MTSDVIIPDILFAKPSNTFTNDKCSSITNNKV